MPPLPSQFPAVLQPFQSSVPCRDRRSSPAPDPVLLSNLPTDSRAGLTPHSSDNPLRRLGRRHPGFSGPVRQIDLENSGLAAIPQQELLLKSPPRQQRGWFG